MGTVGGSRRFPGPNGRRGPEWVVSKKCRRQNWSPTQTLAPRHSTWTTQISEDVPVEDPITPWGRGCPKRFRVYGTPCEGRTGGSHSLKTSRDTTECRYPSGPSPRGLPPFRGGGWGGGVGVSGSNRKLSFQSFFPKGSGRPSSFLLPLL